MRDTSTTSPFLGETTYNHSVYSDSAAVELLVPSENLCDSENLFEKNFKIRDPLEPLMEDFIDYTNENAAAPAPLI